jgi:hypothetical protein
MIERTASAGSRIGSLRSWRAGGAFREVLKRADHGVFDTLGDRNALAILVAVYVRCASGKLAAARIYDDSDLLLTETHWTERPRHADPTVGFYCSSATGPLSHFGWVREGQFPDVTGAPAPVGKRTSRSTPTRLSVGTMSGRAWSGARDARCGRDPGVQPTRRTQTDHAQHDGAAATARPSRSLCAGPP